MPPETALAAAIVAIPFAGAGAIAMLRAGGRGGASAWLAAACSAATATVVGALWLRFSAPAEWRTEWMPAAGVGFGLRVDEVSLLFAVLVAGVGLLAMVYSTAYVPGSREGRGRSSGPAAVYAWLLFFQGSMLGLVFSANLLQFYLFWELLDIAAFLLVGLDWRSRRARASATTVLLFTTLGGLALLVGIVMIGTAAGSFWIPEVVAQGDLLRDSPLFVPALLLVVAGAMAKSAQFPLHVWLPRAMAAPTPVNAMDDAVLVPAAGVFLLVRVHPLFAADPLWTGVLVAAGFGSILVGGTLALGARDLKVLLAYSTVSQFGFAFVLLGYGGEVALAAALFLVFHHALLKSGLFFTVGAVHYSSSGSSVRAWDASAETGKLAVAETARFPPRHPIHSLSTRIRYHATGRREEEGAGASRTRMLFAFAAAGVLAASLAGVPPLGGFWSKEYFFEQSIETGSAVLPVLAVLGSALTVAYMLRWFVVAAAADAAGGERWRRPPARLVLVPGTLAVLTLALGLFPGYPADALVNPAAAAAVAGSPTVDPAFRLDVALLLSAVALPLGGLAFLVVRAQQGRVRAAADAAGAVDGAYLRVARAAEGAGRWTLRLQNGMLLRYTSVTLLALLALVGFAVLSDTWPALPRLDDPTSAGLDWRMTLLLLLVCAGTLLTFVLREHLQMVLVLGAVGYLIAGVFALAFAPNLGLLQVHVETLVTVLLVLPLAAIPRQVRERLFLQTRERVTAGRLALATLAGVAGAWVSWLAIEHLPSDPIAPWYGENAPGLVDATDVVAAVLIQFRALDTLGEIIVFATATLGVLVLSRLIRKEKR